MKCELQIQFAESVILSADENFLLFQEYDHSYFFIASFVGDHVAHHAKALKA